MSNFKSGSIFVWMDWDRFPKVLDVYQMIGCYYIQSNDGEIYRLDPKTEEFEIVPTTIESLKKNARIHFTVLNGKTPSLLCEGVNLPLIRVVGIVEGVEDMGKVFPMVRDRK